MAQESGWAVGAKRGDVRMVDMTSSKREAPACNILAPLNRFWTDMV